MKTSLSLLFLILMLTACGGDGEKIVVTEEQSGEYVNIDQYLTLGEMSTSAFPEVSCSTFENEDLTFSINAIHISKSGNIRPVSTGPESVVLDFIGEGIGDLEQLETIDGENQPNNYQLFYTQETIEVLGIEPSNTEVLAYFDFDQPETKYLTISEWDLNRNNSRRAGNLTKLLPYIKSSLSEIYTFNSLLDRHCR